MSKVNDLNVQPCLLAIAADPPLPNRLFKADKCAKSSSWNSGNARHWASLSLKGPVLLGISIDFNVRLLSLCCTFALLTV